MSNDVSSNFHSGRSIAFFGRRCAFTALPFNRLLAAGVDIRALVLSSAAPIGDAVRLRRYRPSITLGGGSNSLDRIAGEHDIPLYEARRPLGSELRTILEQHEPDLLVASCFPWRIPAPIREASRLGGFNLHPSLLPRFRGPDPLFWAFRTDSRDWGVTIHRLGDAFDTGAILAQTRFAIPDAMPGDELERQAAQLGADLILDVISKANSDSLQGTEQDESEASYQTWSSADELIVERDWSVQRVVNFVVGVQPLGYEPTINTARGLRSIQSARRVSQDASTGETWLDERTVRLPFADGTIEFTLA